MTIIAVTGGSGGAGQAIIRELVQHGYICFNLDLHPHASDTADSFKQVDITDYGEVLSALMGADAVVHLAANPSPDHNLHNAPKRFHNNTLGCYNVFQAAAALGISRVVWGSSETIHGYPFEHVAPVDIPVTEASAAQPQNSYALSKLMTEQMAEHMHKMFGTTFIGLRYSNILYHDINARDNYHKIPSYWQDLSHRKFNLWSYVDSKDTATATRLALAASISGAETFIIGAADTLMNCPNQALLDANFPGLQCPDGFGEYQSFINSDKAARLLGYKAEVSWRDYVAEDGTIKEG